MKKKKKRDMRKAMSLLHKRRYGLSAKKKTQGADSESESEEERPGRAYMLKEVCTPVKKEVEEEFEVNMRAAQRFCNQLLDPSDSDEDEIEKEKGVEGDGGMRPGNEETPRGKGGHNTGCSDIGGSARDQYSSAPGGPSLRVGVG